IDTLSLAAARCYNSLGSLFASRSYFEDADIYFKKSLRIYKKHKDLRGQHIVYSNMGGNLLLQGKAEEALVCFLEVQKIVTQEKYIGEEKVYAAFYLGAVYAALRKFDLAEKYYNEALNLVDQKEYQHLKTFITFQYALNLFDQKRYTEAKKNAFDVLALARQKGLKHLQITSLDLIWKIYRGEGNYKEANQYLLSCYSLRDSVYSKEREEKLVRVKAEFDSYKSEQEKIQKEQDLLLAQEIVKKRNFQMGFLGIICIGSLVLLFILFNRTILQKRTNKSLKNTLLEISEADKSRIEILEKTFGQELDTKNKELTSNALLFLRQNNIISSIYERTKALKVNLSMKGKDRVLVMEIESLLKEIANHQGWEEFETYFEQVDKAFFSRLLVKYPNLNMNEQRLCALFSLKLTSKEIASLSKRTVRSVAMAKLRLKKKLDLGSDDDLFEHLSKI
ncbi:MAG: tetratricopeptide repeat protein, partial [Bacteroidales bacterium]